jgi:membrane protein
MLWVQRVRQFIQKFLDDRALTLASLVAWGLLNTLLPTLLGMLALLGLLFGSAIASSAVEGMLFTMLPPQVTSIVHNSLVGMQQVAGLAGLISLGLLLFTGSNLFVTLESVFDLAYHVPERGLIKQRVVSFAGLFALTGLVLLGSGAAALGGAFSTAAQSTVSYAWEPIGAALTIAASVLVLAGVFTLMYWSLPNTNNSFKHSVPGGVVAAVLFIALTRLFPLYVSLFGGGFSVYAAFGTVLLFVFWLYLVGVVLVGGAVLNAFLEGPDRAVALSALAAKAIVGKLEVP